MTLGAVREDERDGCMRRLEAFTERYRGRLQELVRLYGPGSAPAEHGRYAPVGRPESLAVCERMENAPLLRRSGGRNRWTFSCRTTSSPYGAHATA
ncbi:hypothetical protein [Streptomyces kebangsaanensis]|uniref:hypothetical protein n=1 Tax=Streptomyces kebangsaanensis TaxID=864058 RepID=UPI00093D9C09|nr:hypothetical protein [Streptomyces kebangsaanensis]